MNFLISITIALLVSFILGELFYRLKWPIVVSQMLAGILLGLPFIKEVLFIESSNIMKFLADLGIVFLLFLTGLEVDRNKLYKIKKDATIIAVFASLVPLVLSFIVMKLLGYSNLVALLVGVCISITAEGTNAKVLMELKKLGSKLGTRLIAAGIIDDVVGVFLFIIISLIFGQSILADSTLYGPLQLVGFVIIIWIIFKTLPSVIKFEESETKEIREVSLFTTVLLMCLVFAVLGLVVTGTLSGGVIAAFVAGIAIQFSMSRKEEHIIRSHFKTMALALIVPFFFIGIGLDFDFDVFINGKFLLIVIFFMAIIGKILGTLFASRFTGMNIKQSLLMGWGMNSRGGIELAIALIALRLGAIDSLVYSAIVGMSFITTFIFPFVFKFILNKNPRIMY